MFKVGTINLREVTTLQVLYERGEKLLTPDNDEAIVLEVIKEEKEDKLSHVSDEEGS